jgi:glucose/arabinose dehydrogenase/PKD repeat protein
VFRYPAIVAVLGLLISVDPYYAAGQTSGTFQIDNQFVTGLQSPTAMAFAADGRLFITEQAGVVRIVTAAGQLLPTPFLTLSGIESNEEAGLLGLAFDPDFASTGYVYIFYTPNTPNWTSRLSRVTANGNSVVPDSEVILFEYENFSGNHRGGDIHFGPDDKLYVALGDAGNPDDAQSVTSFDGKILRLNSDGSIPFDNPAAFTSTQGLTLTPASQYRAIWAIGLRNPYRFAFDLNGRMYINDVGQAEWEEINLGQAGRNYGWPTCEGLCANAYAENPVYVYDHDTDACAITGGTFYNATQFPAEYHGNYFLIDFCGSWVRHLRTDDTPATFPITVPEFSVDVKVGPDGQLYLLGHGAGSISRITYVPDGANRNPTAVIAADPTSGPVPLTVNFDGSGSTDPDGDSLTFSWQFGDGSTAAGPTVLYTYSSAGTYTASLTVTDGRGGSNSQQVAIAVGAPPVATITTPQPGSLYSAGDTISFAGVATDPDEGPLPSSAFSWTVLFHHDAHTHPVLGPLSGVTSGSFVVPTSGHTEDNVFYRIYLTVTDSSGLQTYVTREVFPRKVTITLTTNVSGAQVLLDGQPHQAPYTFVSVVGVQRSIEVPAQQSINGDEYYFATWSNGGRRNQTVSTPTVDMTYDATLGFSWSTGGIGTIDILPPSDPKAMPPQREPRRRR